VNKSITVSALTGELEIGRRDEIAALLVRPAPSRHPARLFDVRLRRSTSLAELLRFRDDADKQNVPSHRDRQQTVPRV